MKTPSTFLCVSLAMPISLFNTKYKDSATLLKMAPSILVKENPFQLYYKLILNIFSIRSHMLFKACL